MDRFDPVSSVPDGWTQAPGLLRRRVSSVLTVLATLSLLAAASSPGLARQAPEPVPTPVQTPAPAPRSIDIVVKRYAFEPAVVEVTAGEGVRLVVTSADGVHGLEIKQFKVGKEIPRGDAPVIIEFTADALGRFPILCSAYCGNGHDDMKGTLVVLASAPTN